MPRRFLQRHIIIFLIACCHLHAAADTGSFTLNATVTDRTNGEPLPTATVRLQPGMIGLNTDAEGHFAIRLQPGRHTLDVSYIGYRTWHTDLDLTSDTTLTISLTPDERTLSEVVVTATQSSSLTSGSRIDRDAMSHLQPTSFADILELLPGNISHTPDMSRTNAIALRETGTIGGAGSVVENPDYAISSLGTPFVIDGTPVNTDANLNEVPGASSGDVAYSRSSKNRGVDMRAIATDNIESVEVMQGIPSAEYGNLTSGVVNIRRIRRTTPWTARFKADEFSKLFSVGKGFGIGSQVINADIGYLDSKSDPRDNLENYKRVNASVRARLRFEAPDMVTAWNIGLDYTGSFDNSKTDPDLNQNKIDLYRSRYNRAASSSDVTFTFPRLSWLESVGLSTSASYVSDRLTRIRDVSPNGTTIAPTSTEEGVHDGHYILKSYLADFRVDGKPVDIFAKLKANGSVSTGTWLHAYKVGLEWTFSKNYGRGQIYDPDRPLSGGWTTRPRAYSDVPAMHIVSAFVEDGVTALIGSNKLELQLGARFMTMPALDSRYYLSGRPCIDPRINAQWQLPSFFAGDRPMTLSIAAGYGLTTKLPTLDYLFPQVHYSDFVQLGYFNVNDPVNLSRVNLRTYITDPTNYDLRAARNRKWEVRLGAEWGGNKLSVTYFQEHLNSGYRYSAVYDTYTFRRYDASAIDGSTLTAPPSLDNLPYTDMQILDGYNRVTNGSRIDKRGIEFSLRTARWQPLRTALTVTGAWLHTRYSNSQMLFYPVGTVIGNTAVSDRYVGIYDTDDGRVNDQFNTNFMFDTQIPRWGLIFTTTVQVMWWTKTRRMRENGVPVSYLASDGNIYPYDREAAAADPMLAQLVRDFSDNLFDTQRVPIALYLNFKATKQIGRFLRISAFVNRIIDYLPDYKSNGLTIRRTSEAYFGMEATLTL